MKNKPLAGLILFAILLSVFNHRCSVEESKKGYLEKILQNLEQIESASYYSYGKSTALGDTSKMLPGRSETFTKEYDNPGDPYIGSIFAHFEYNDTTRMTYYYDGDSRCRLNWDEKTFEVDSSFRDDQLPFRPIGPPFFNYAESIVRYALESNDSIKTEIADLGDSIRFTLTIYDKVVEFFGQPAYMEENYFRINPGVERISIYDIWIDKRDNLPYRLKRHQPHNISWRSVSDVVLNSNYPAEFRGTAYIPPDFVNRRELKREVPPVMDLDGKQAPDWVLSDFDNNPVALSDFKSKVLMMKFTGIGCGPCHLAIPFLKKLVESYDADDFALVGIETWSEDLSALKNYFQNNELNFTFLNATDLVTQNYNVRGVPAFFIMDENRVIRKIITGYGKGSTDEEIKNSINELL